jgi:hypothetical protein
VQPGHSVPLALANQCKHNPNRFHVHPRRPRRPRPNDQSSCTQFHFFLRRERETRKARQAQAVAAHRAQHSNTTITWVGRLAGGARMVTRWLARMRVAASGVLISASGQHRAWAHGRGVRLWIFRCGAEISKAHTAEELRAAKDAGGGVEFQVGPPSLKFQVRWSVVQVGGVGRRHACRRRA